MGAAPGIESLLNFNSCPAYVQMGVGISRALTAVWTFMWTIRLCSMTYPANALKTMVGSAGLEPATSCL